MLISMPTKCTIQRLTENNLAMTYLQLLTLLLISAACKPSLIKILPLPSKFAIDVWKMTLKTSTSPTKPQFAQEDLTESLPAILALRQMMMTLSQLMKHIVLKKFQMLQLVVMLKWQARLELALKMPVPLFHSNLKCSILAHPEFEM